MEHDEAIDYSSPAWRFAVSVNDYFAGWEPITIALGDDEYEQFRRVTVKTCETACQTDEPCPAFQAPGEANDGARSRADRRKRVLEDGTPPPHSQLCAAFHLSRPLDPNSYIHTACRAQNHLSRSSPRASPYIGLSLVALKQMRMRSSSGLYCYA